jgi:hypothetical protein
MIRGSAGCLGIDPTKPKLGQIEFFDEDIDHAKEDNKIISRRTLAYWQKLTAEIVVKAARSGAALYRHEAIQVGRHRARTCRSRPVLPTRAGPCCEARERRC